MLSFQNDQKCELGESHLAFRSAQREDALDPSALLSLLEEARRAAAN